MTFECCGVRYYPDDLIAYETGDRHTPLVYLTRDYACVLVGTLDPWKGLTVRQADAVEIKSLAARFGLDDLKRALK